MSNSVFPPPGVRLSLSYKRTAKVNATRHEVDSGYDSTITRTVWPRYEYDLPFNVLQQNDPLGVDGHRELLGFWLKHKVHVPFLFRDPQDYVVTNAIFAAGNDVDVTFRLVRPFGSFWAEPINNVESGTLTVEQGPPGGPWSALTLGVDYTVDLTLGLVTVGTPVPLGERLRASFEFYWRAKFMGDSQEVSRIEHNIFSARRVQLETQKIR